MTFSRLAALLSLVLAAPSGAATAPPLTPNGKWVLDFADQQCVATRNYGSAADPIVFALKPSPMGKLMQLVLLLRSRSGRGPVETPAEIRIDGGGPLRSGLLAFNIKQGGLRSVRINLPLDQFAPMRNATRVSITGGLEIDESFVLTDMPALTAEMDRCLADLQRYWNIDEAGKARLRSHAKADLRRFLTDSDYPDIAMSKDEAGKVGFALLVDETGKVVDCTLTATSNVPILDAQTCAAMLSRARFTPAIGADGKPAKDGVADRVSYVMP